MSQPKECSKLEKAAAEFFATVRNVLELRSDTETPAPKLATAMTTAKEAVQIAAVRLAVARSETTAESVMKLREDARMATAEAERLEAEADHLDKTARGTVAALYGEAAAENLHSRGKRCLKAIEIRSQAAGFRSRAEFLEADARSTAGFQPAPTTSAKISMRDLTPGQVAGRMEDILAALNDGRLQE